MKPKVILILALLSMVIVSVSHAAVTVSIDGPYTKVTNETLTIPVSISGYTGHYAAQFVVDFGKVKALTPTVSTKSGDIYYPVEDYSGYTLKSEWDAHSKWYETKEAAIDYKLIGSKLKIYVVSPEAQQEKGSGALDSGTMFTIGITVGSDSKPDIIMFGGEVLNNNAKETVGLGSSAVVNISGYTPVSIISDPADLTGKTEQELKNVTAILDMGALGGAVPSQITAVVLKNEDYTPTKDVGVQLEGGTVIKKADGTAYTGYLKPPEAKSYSELSKDEQDSLPDAWKGDSYKISAGAAEKLNLTKYALMLLKVRLKTKSPKVYYLPENAAPEEAGVSESATVEGKSYSITKGGTIIGQASAPAGETDYTIAVLLDHLSTFVVAPPLPTAAAPVSGGDGGTCFIATAAFGSANDWHVKTLRDFRDRFLLTSDWGKAFVDAYYRYSPPVASYLTQHEALRTVVRVALVPVAGLAYVTMYQPVLLLIGFVLVFGFVGILIRKRLVRV